MHAATILAVIVSTFAYQSFAAEPQLVYTGMLATEVMARTRVTDFHKGDLMYVTVHQPAHYGLFSVSVHAEYLDSQNQWQDIPTPNTSLGRAYRSTKYGGVRDYVYFPDSPNAIEHNVSLFVPYAAFHLQDNKHYSMRYVIRLWNRADDDITYVALQPDDITTQRESGKTVITYVRAKACRALIDESDEPVPEAESAGIVRFFNTQGEWVCPNE